MCGFYTVRLTPEGSSGNGSLEASFYFPNITVHCSAVELVIFSVIYYSNLLQCSAVQCSVIYYSIILQCIAVQSEQCSAVLCNLLQYYIAVQCSTVHCGGNVMNIPA